MKTTVITKEVADLIQYEINATIEWVDDMVTNGVDEYWSKTVQNRKYPDLKQGDCEDYSSDAIALVRDFPDSIRDTTFDLFNIDKNKYADFKVDLDNLGHFFVFVEKPNDASGVVDGTKARGGHSILTLLNEDHTDAYCLDNRQLKFLVDGMSVDKEMADWLNSNPFPYWIDKTKNPFGIQFIEPFVPTISEIADKAGEGYLFITGNCYGLDKACNGEWTIHNHPKWQFMYPIIKYHRSKARNEGIL